MVGLKNAAGWLDLAEGAISLEINNPFFSADSVPGTITYPFGLPMTAGNLARLNFPHLRADQGDKIAPEPAGLYLDGVLRWAGSLVYLDCDEAQQMFQYNFVADAADLATRIDGVSLPGLDLGLVPLTLVPDAPAYALPCVRNTLFYDVEKVPAYGHVVNYYRDGLYQLKPGGKRAPIVPFPRLVFLIRAVLGAVGYTASGPWLAEPEVQRLVVYSDRAAEDAAGNLLTEFALNRHVPDIGVGDFLVAIQKFCGVGYGFHPVRRDVRFVALADVIADPAYVDRVGGPARTTAVTSDGFTLEMELEADDELNKTLDTGWKSLVVGNGKEALSTAAGTLHVLREADPLDAGRQWLVPAVEVKGASAAFEAGDDSRCGLRLLYDRGLQPDSRGATYPLATWDTVDFAGRTVGARTLRWAGDGGLYATAYAGWLAFLDRATTKERTVQFGVADLLSLDPARKDLVDHKKYLWEKVSLSLSTTGRQLETAAFTYRYTRL
ncbi:hypothetical protein [Hymenobacter nivis]|uniref:Uncharacterized protein n=1 Tax=Hymenobacter nivis TaxID=1850093 RepID=A0A502HD63_9BACT|nr:hypothetical protein [Hymenobacter nivis]TPG71974.1 hypothetical protein EAH73_01645 [Hymenobacter nivis]